MASQEDRIVYSTRSLPFSPYEETETPSHQDLRVSRRRIAGNREVTEVTGFVGRAADLHALAKELRQVCATGGSTSEGKILLQGNFVDKVLAYLKSKGHKAKKSGG
ncbi:MAG: translation initiation factor [Bacteroidia bacterium]|nr:translation initiation factor [Bacteroidia bacterium]